MDINKRLQFKTDENGFISEFMNVGSEGILPEGIAIEIDIDNFDFDDFLMNYQAYKFDGNKIERVEEQLPLVIEENEKNYLRMIRMKECFPIINRGSLWYDGLQPEQRTELGKWYNDWLNVTDTHEIPQKPSWLE